MKITTLIENRGTTAKPALTAEWGLSLHIEFNNHRCFFGYTGLCGLLIVGWPALFILLPEGIPAIRFDVGS